jgi:hypothetical protein
MFDTRHFFRGGGSPPREPETGPVAGSARRRGRRRLVLLAAAVAVPVAVLAQAAPALAATSPTVSISCAATNNCTADGSGFTSGGKVQVQALAGTTSFYSSSLVASTPTRTCITTPKPVCVTVPGGFFSAPLPIDYGLACNATAAGTMEYTDVSKGVTVSEPVTWTGPCAQPTTTTLSIPSGLDTGWSATNPAYVMAGSTRVTSGTISITVDGVSYCSYSLAGGTGCTLANLPVGTYAIDASYSGSTIPPEDTSSATVNVTVDQVQPTAQTSSSNWSGYVATGGNFTAASASWTVPVANCLSPSFQAATDSATWVGIDGWGGNTVEQIGTDSNCVAGNPSYWAWWEMYPNLPTVIGGVTSSYPVFGGDSMNATVTYTGTPGTYKLTITDNSESWSFSTTQSISGTAGASAECAVERPSFLGLPLAPFGTATFTNCQAATGGGPLHSIWDYPNLAVNLTSSSDTLSSVSGLSNDGTQFTATWHNGT